MEKTLNDILQKLSNIENYLVDKKEVNTKNISNIYIDTKQLADRWKMDSRSIHNLRLKGKGPSYIQPAGPNGKVLYKLEELIEYEEGKRINTIDSEII